METVEDQERRPAELEEIDGPEGLAEADDEIGDGLYGDSQRLCRRGTAPGRWMGRLTEGMPLPQEYRRQHAKDGAGQGKHDGERRSATTHVAEPRQFHEPEEPGRDQPCPLGDEVLHAHEPRAFVVVRRQFVAEGDPGRREYRVGEIEDERSDEEVVEVERLTASFGKLPEQREDHGRGDGAAEDIGPASSPAGSGVVRNVAHDGIGDGIRQAGYCGEQADQAGFMP